MKKNKEKRICKCTYRIMPEPFRQRIKRGIALPHILAQHVVVVDALRAGHDFLAAHEEVVAVGEVRRGGVRVGVEGADAEGVFVDGEEVGGVFFVDEAAEGAFLGGAVGEGKGC